MDEISLHIDAPAERIYDLVADVTQMGRWSPECTGGTWLDGAGGPAVGARFKGSNKRGLMRWSTKCVVTKADRPSAFEWQVSESGMLWGYRFEADGAGTLVTEYRQQTRDTPFYVKAVQRSGLLGKDRDHLMVDGMRQTLERLKQAAERG
jgi:uncharacterized protein YndB with AHSA1/START domain